MSNSVFFSDDDPGLAGLKEEFEAAFDADLQAHADEAFRAHADAHFRAHAEAALRADPDNALLQSPIQIGLLLRATQWELLNSSPQ